MTKPLTPEQFMESIERKLMPKIKKIMPGIKLGKVVSVSGTTANVRLDGDTKTTPVARFCAASANQRAIVIKQGTQYYLLGVQ